jgi:hypothetical protein
VGTSPHWKENFVDALVAIGPRPEFSTELMLFGRFVGSWEITWRGYLPEPSGPVIGEWHWAWVLDGMAVQDVWIGPSRTEMANGAEPDEYGSSIRSYDPRTQTWKVAWHGPGNGNLRTFTASQVGDDVVLEGTTLDGRPMHWIISEITEDSYHWRSVVTDDSGETWQLREDAEVRRVG